MYVLHPPLQREKSVLEENALMTKGKSDDAERVALRKGGGHLGTEGLLHPNNTFANESRSGFSYSLQMDLCYLELYLLYYLDHRALLLLGN